MRVLQEVEHARGLFIATTMVFTIAIVAACGTSHPTAPDATGPLTPVAITDDWPIGTPAEAGLDVARMTDLVQRLRAGRYGRMASLLVVRDGRLVVEEYFNGWSAGASHTLQSVTKSVTALLTGIAVQSGQLALDDRVTRYFAQYEPIPVRRRDPFRAAAHHWRSWVSWFSMRAAGGARRSSEPTGSA